MNRILHFAAVVLTALVLMGVAGCGQNKAIHDAAWNGDLAKVTALLQANPDLVNRKNNLGETPLNCAALRGHRDVAKLLLASKAEVDF